jgi:sugar O-acyltransferase (sialic acid O-acetyltransferase NeuD family)
MKKLIIFGVGDIAQIANYYFTKDTDYKVVAFTLNGEYIKESVIEGIPVIPFEDIQSEFSTREHDLFVALSYSNMNRLRKSKFEEAKNMGYKIASYISPHCTYLSQYSPGENAFIFEDNTIQPFVKIGDNVTIWSGNHIGHHSEIQSHNFISSHVVISGHCIIEPFCFLGVNSTIGHQVRIKSETLLGAGAVVSKDSESKGVYVPAKSIKLDKTSDQFNL